MLSQDNKDMLLNKKHELQSQNEQISSGIISDQNVVENLRMLDFPYKRILDEKHYNIDAFQQEARLLSGRTVFKNSENNAIYFSSSVPDTKIQILDGRFVVYSGVNEYINIPIVKSRGQQFSSATGPNFEIWTMGRHGCCTSVLNVSQSYSISLSNNELSVMFDGSVATVNVFDPDELSSVGTISISAEGLASLLTASLQSFSSDIRFSQSVCSYDPVRKTFSIASGTIGSLSTASVLLTTPLAFLMGFSGQVSIGGRDANNKLKISIDGVEKDIIINRDVRACDHNVSLGYNNDVYGAKWKILPTEGPYTCSLGNNGDEIARIIQQALRSIGTGGYSLSECVWLSSSNTFVIRSGTIGETSSVEVLPSLSNDLAPDIGFDSPSRTLNNEKSFVTVDELIDELSDLDPNLICEPLIPQTYSCYSLTTISVPVDISNGFFATYTPDFDSASLQQPPLYRRGKLRINDSNNAFEVLTPTGENLFLIPQGDYTELELVDALNNHFLSTIQFSYDAQTKRFVFKSSVNCSILCRNGKSRERGIYFDIELDISNDISLPANVSVYSAVVSFSSTDPMSLYRPMQYFIGFPIFFNTEISESSLLLKEDELLELEDSLLTQIKDMTFSDNYALFDHWLLITGDQFAIAENGLKNISQQLVLYSRISTSNATYLNKKLEQDSLKLNIDSLNDNSQLINTSNVIHEFYPDVDYFGASLSSLSISVTGPDDIRFADLIDFVKYSDGSAIYGTFSGLFSQNMTFTPIGHEFRIKSNRSFVGPDPVTQTKLTIDGTQVISEVFGSFGSQIDFQYQFSSYPKISDLLQVINDNNSEYEIDYKASILGRISEPFVVDNDTNEFNVTVDNLPLQTKVFNFSGGTLESGSLPAISISAGSFLTISLNDSGEYVINISNNKIDFSEDGGFIHLVATVASGSYTGPSLATAITAALLSAGTAIYFVTFNDETLRFNLTMIPTLSQTFDLLFNSGSNNSLSIANTIGFSNVDLSGSFSYVSDFFANTSPAYEIELGELHSGESIAQEITRKVRMIQSNISTDQPAFDLFECEYLGSSYKMHSGTKGTSSSVRLIDTQQPNDIISNLKLRDQDGAQAVQGTGDCQNNYNVSAQEIVTFFSSSPITNAQVLSFNGHIKILSSSYGFNKKIQIQSSDFADSIGFSNGYDFNDPLDSFTSLSSKSLINISSQEISSYFSFYSGYDPTKLSIQWSYYTQDDSKIEDRRTIVNNRRAQIALRLSQIGNEYTTAVNSLLPSIYNDRWSWVEKRLDPINGPYKKVGDKEKSILNSIDLISSNNDQISDINSMLLM